MKGCEISEYVEAETEQEINEDVSEDDNSSPIAKVRALFIKIRRSEQWGNKFKSCCESTNVKYLSLPLDVSTRWNSSCDMITAALKVQSALDALCNNNPELNSFKITTTEWSTLKQINLFLMNFKTFSTLLGGEDYVTLPMVVIGFNLLVDKLEKNVKRLDEREDRMVADKNLIVSFQAARDKMIKHYDKLNWIYCAVLILDPRHNKDTFTKTTWEMQLMNQSIAKVLIFPQLQSKYRWLAHKFVEQEFFEDVCTFSVGKDDLRRLIVAKIDIVMRHSYPFRCVHEKLQSLNNDQDPLTCSCTYEKIAVLKQNVKPNLSDLNPEEKTLPINNISGMDVLVKSHVGKKHNLTISSNKNSVEYKTECKMKRTDKPLYVPPAQRTQRNHASASETRTELESMEKINNKQSKSHLSFHQQKNNVLTRENNHFKNMNADLTHEKECSLDNVVPNPPISLTQNQLVIDSDKMEECVDSRETAIFKEKTDAVDNQEVALLIEFINEREGSFDSIVPNPSVSPSQNKLVIDSDKMKESIDSKGPANFKEKTETIDNQEVALLIQNCHLENYNSILLAESTDVINRFSENPVSDSELDDVSVTCSENANLSLLKSDLKVDFNLRTVMNSINVFEQRAKVEIPFTSKHTDSFYTVCSDTARDLDTDLIKELRAVIGNAEIHSAEHNYSEFKLSDICEEGIIKEEFPDMIEIYGFPVELKTRDLLLVFSNFKSENFTLKWVDDTHAIGIFSSPSLASQALELDHPYVKVRPLAEGLRGSKLVAKRHTKNRESPKSRPATSAATAKRLVTVALGLKVNMPRKDENGKQKIGNAKENYETLKSQPATSAASAKHLVTEALGLNVNTRKKEKEKRKTRKAKGRKE